MRRLDYIKEKLGYYKFWQGIVVVTDISVAGWFIAAVDDAGRFRVVLHRQIAAYIEEIGKL